jgi:hypothetical protein
VRFFVHVREHLGSHARVPCILLSLDNGDNDVVERLHTVGNYFFVLETRFHALCLQLALHSGRCVLLHHVNLQVAAAANEGDGLAIAMLPSRPTRPVTGSWESSAVGV